MTDEQRARGALAELYPLPTWQVIPPGDVFRVFERGGRNIGTQFPEIGLPNPTGIIQRLEEPGRPDIRQSNRGPGTGLRVAIPVLNIHKTRLNDPYMWFMGTNDQPGDYRHSGCAGCHVVYANDREPRHSLTYAQYGRDGQTATADPTIAARRPQHADAERHGERQPGAPIDQRVGERGHPIRHVFTRAIPTAQCMNCHMHQPNIFLNSYLGYTMWDYESDARRCGRGRRTASRRTPEESASAQPIRPPRSPRSARPQSRRRARRAGCGATSTSCATSTTGQPARRRTPSSPTITAMAGTSAAIFKRDREGNLLDADGKVIPPDDPEKFRRDRRGPVRRRAGINPGKAVHMMDIHAEKGMQCADCHFSQDSHGNGLIYGEVANAVEIGCQDCHGTAAPIQPAHLRPGRAARAATTSSCCATPTASGASNGSSATAAGC